ncbi:alpha/beta hydrolase [Alteromonas gilva]|uniref:Alpha/beta hydrolase n=1 Tax=Alteromonas gilva TaxID=2987522 RepID=A0ABT5L2G2_9ALTE|nr:alpha/beta hydrolase [Alteromonas gilva]MDC8830586.1 alpha/beta hydrolase [Alteromonas gilva]
MQQCEFLLSGGALRGLTNGGTGPVVLGLHGFLDNAASLACLAPAFKDYQFIALDLPGHGKSFHRPAGAQYNQLDYVQDIHELVLSQDWQNVFIVGHSLGGILASIYAAVFSEYVTGIASIDACGPLTLEADTTTEQIRASLLSRLPKPKSVERATPRIVNLESAVQARCQMTDTREEHARQILSRNIKQLDSGETTWSSDPRLRTKSTLRLTAQQAENIMRNIACPAWFGGASDSFKNLQDVYAVRKVWLKSSRFELFSGGHHFHMVNPTAVGVAICQFVEQM